MPPVWQLSGQPCVTGSHYRPSPGTKVPKIGYPRGQRKKMSDSKLFSFQNRSSLCWRRSQSHGLASNLTHRIFYGYLVAFTTKEVANGACCSWNMIDQPCMSDRKMRFKNRHLNRFVAFKVCQAQHFHTLFGIVSLFDFGRISFIELQKNNDRFSLETFVLAFHTNKVDIQFEGHLRGNGPNWTFQEQ